MAIGRRLLDHGDKLGFNDALIRGHQPEAVNTRCSSNGTVGGVAQNTQGRDVDSHLISQRKEAKNRIGM